VTRFLALRLAQIPLIVLAVYTVTFLLAWQLPGSAVINDEGRQPPQAVLDAMEARYNLDNSWTFYWQYLADATGVSAIGDVITGQERIGPVFDLGPSLRNEDWTVNEIIASSPPVSVVLGLSAILIALSSGLVAGALGAIRPNSWIDLSTLVVALIGISLPSFVTGTVLLILGPVLLGWGQVGSWGRVENIFLPAFTLSLPFAAYIARLTRFGMIDEMNADYVRTARAKGVAEWRVVIKHALKNAALPVLSFLGRCCRDGHDRVVRGREDLRGPRHRHALRQRRARQGSHADYGRGPRLLDDPDRVQPRRGRGLPLG